MKNNQETHLECAVVEHKGFPPVAQVMPRPFGSPDEQTHHHLFRLPLSRNKRLLALTLVVFSFLCVATDTLAQQPDSASQFTNPLLSSGADPWVVTWNGSYYYMNTTGKDLTLWKTRDITDLRHATKKVVWAPEPGHAWSNEVWAPELHRWDNKWYIYFAADDGTNDSHRIYVVENASSDPLDGAWTLKGKVSDATDRWAIDPTILEVNHRHYMLWSGWPGASNGEQDIWIASMKNPWTIDSPRTMISHPQFAWEEVGDLPQDPALPHVNVNEGPEILKHGSDLFLVYSASGCWTDYYELGIAHASTSADLLNAASWQKYDHPFFREDSNAQVFGTGHNGFFRSPDGTQDWIIYHANSAPHQGCGEQRSPRMQPFSWNKDGTPNFGTPIASGIPLDKPSQK